MNDLPCCPVCGRTVFSKNGLEQRRRALTRHLRHCEIAQYFNNAQSTAESVATAMAGIATVTAVATAAFKFIGKNTHPKETS